MGGWGRGWVGGKERRSTYLLGPVLAAAAGTELDAGLPVGGGKELFDVFVVVHGPQRFLGHDLVGEWVGGWGWVGLG